MGTGEITQKLGTRHYIVELGTGRRLTCHINQLRKTNIPPVNKPKASKSVKFVDIHGPVPAPQLQSPAHSPTPPKPLPQSSAACDTTPQCQYPAKNHRYATHCGSASLLSVKLFTCIVEISCPNYNFHFS